MNILYCGDSNIEKGLLISLLSLTRHVEEPLCVYVLTIQDRDGIHEPVSAQTAAFLDKMLQEKNPESFLRLIDITELFYAEMPTANMVTRFTPYCMLRLYADRVPTLPDRLLYLDSDVVCRSDPYDFYHQELPDKDMAGVLDYYGSWAFRQHFWKRDYVNSGVLLLNMKAIRKDGLFARCRKMCRTKRMFMPDQSALNKESERKQLCPRRYNEQRKLRKDTVFQHFTTSFRFFPWIHTVCVKPWQIEEMHETLGLHEYDDVLREYEELLPMMEI